MKDGLTEILSWPMCKRFHTNELLIFIVVQNLAGGECVDIGIVGCLPWRSLIGLCRH
jgi:hypothetical protein